MDGGDKIFNEVDSDSIPKAWSYLGLLCLNWKNHRDTQEVRPDARQIKDPLGPEFSNSIEPQKKGERNWFQMNILMLQLQKV